MALLPTEDHPEKSKQASRPSPSCCPSTPHHARPAALGQGILEAGPFPTVNPSHSSACLQASAKHNWRWVPALLHGLRIKSLCLLCFGWSWFISQLSWSPSEPGFPVPADAWLHQEQNHTQGPHPFCWRLVQSGRTRSVTCWVSILLSSRWVYLFSVWYQVSYQTENKSVPICLASLVESDHPLTPLAVLCIAVLCWAVLLKRCSKETQVKTGAQVPKACCLNLPHGFCSSHWTGICLDKLRCEFHE